MSYNIVNPISVEDTWKNGSVMDAVNNYVAQQPTDEEAFARQVNLYHNIPVDYTGNINLASRPAVQNPDGSVSTVRSKSFGIDGKEVLLPTISPDGRALSDSEAVDQYIRTGQHLGKFDTPESATAMAQRIHDQQAYGVNNSVFNQTHRAENPQPVPPQPTTQIANQGMNRRPTLNDYKAFALDYLTKKGYSYEDAMELMRPEFEIYAAREQAQNQAMADKLVSDMQGMKIDSPEYRQAAFQLYRLDPKLGTFMLKEGIGPREQYLRSQKREDAQYTNDMQFQNWMRKLNIQDQRQQKAIADKIQQLVTYGGLDRQTAAQMVFGGVRNARGTAVNGNSGVSEKDYKRAVDGLKNFVEKIAEKRLENPDYQLSPEEQQEYNMLYAIKQRGDKEFYARNGLINQQQPQQVKLNPNDYYSFGPLLQDMVKQNGGKMSKDVARALRKRLGFDPDDNSPNNFVNQVMKEQYGFSG